MSISVNLYEYLTEEEAEVALLVARRTNADCWFKVMADPDHPGFCRVFDIENGRFIPAALALEDLAGCVEVAENYDLCRLTEEQDGIFRESLRKRYIHFVVKRT